ncbi:esterase [Brevirhabdus pacifica]|uniref:Esterase n=1 Tax=Brevirhabdus pacifica TaxID=1267768 RepID=A0A1U7DKN8_9RHOB|nr:alpha/beta fold hydrolase [Brevirhabdus pacifica]APX90438.1 esterase [Brevirhabdus pacifica]OWU78543.1 esterase [Loktanella sp. 22II-4b]PJJ85464.1 pimeloyl-ACP methyl ester carboxylesterase [Brevirhabdus pacifica]
MARFLLIHGSCHGAWCWDMLISELEALGHAARAIDLPGAGDDATPVGQVTLAAYRDAVVAALDDGAGPSILLGHSAGGFPITAAAEEAPELVRALVYLCAYVPKPGQSLVDLRRAAPRQPLMPAVKLAEDGKSFTVRPEMREEVFYHDCPPEARALADAKLRPQPVAPQATALGPTPRADRLPRHYIRCTQDRTIPPEYQLTLSKDFTSGNVHALNSAHSPFFSQPATLAALLNTISEAL